MTLTAYVVQFLILQCFLCYSTMIENIAEIWTVDSSHWEYETVSTFKLTNFWSRNHWETNISVVSFFRNGPISIFPYVKIEAKYMKEKWELMCSKVPEFAQNFSKLTLNLGWQVPKTFRISCCSVQCNYVP